MGMKLAHKALNGDYGKRSNRISASDCLEHLRHSVAKTNPRFVHGIFFSFFFFFNFGHLALLARYSLLPVPDTMGTSASNGTLRFGFALNDFIPTWIVLAPTFPTDSPFVTRV